MAARANETSHDGPLAERPVLRLLIGLCRLSMERIGHTLELVSGRPRLPTPSALPPGTGRRALVGAVASLPAWRAAALERARSSGPARLARRMGAALEQARPTKRLMGRLATARGRALLALGRLAMLGEEEERRDRALASAAVEEIVDATCARLAENQAIRRLVREQATGLTASAITALRTRCAGADAAIERALARLPSVFRRRQGRWRRRLLPAESTP